MVDTYTILKSIHVVGAVMWVGSGFLLNIAITLAFLGPQDEKLA